MSGSSDKSGFRNAAGAGRLAHSSAARRFAAAAMVLGLGACASLPISGPTGHQVIKDSQDPKSTSPFHIIEITGAADMPQRDTPPALARAEIPPSTDLVGAGDVLDIEIYEVGVTLFSGSHGNSSIGAGAPAASGGAQVERLPAVKVQDDGRIRLPFVGQMRAAGHTTDELASMIRKALHGMSQDPQVSVTIAQNISGSVIVSGEVAKPGRLVLPTNRETLSDAVALSGGYRGDAKDLVARVTRGGTAFDYRLSDVMSGPARDMQMSPGDRLQLVRAPMSYSVLGAPGKVEVFPFAAPEVNLAEAVATAGGASPYYGDAKAIFLFRYVAGENGKLQPVVYHLNMMQPGAYFLSQHFAMRDKDVIYVGNAASNQSGKLIQLVSQLFSPIVGVESGLVSAGVIK